jgi:Transposase DDE domain group 1
MDDLMPPLPGLSPVGGKVVVARFDGGCLSSDAGVLVLREIEQRLGVAERLAGCIDDPRAQAQVVHGLAEMIRFRMLVNGGVISGRCGGEISGHLCWR